MSDVRARDAAIRRELGVPPTFDLVAHVRNLSRVMLPALVIALIAGGAMYLVRGSESPVYESDIVAEVQAGSQVVVSDANLGQLVAPYTALASDSAVVASIQSRMDNGWTASDVSSHIAVTPGTSPALVSVKATGSSQEEADRLARTVVEILSDAQSQRNAETLALRTKALTDDIARLNSQLAAARQESIDNDETPIADPTTSADLDARLEQLRQLRASDSTADRLQLLSAPTGTGLPVAPKPFAEAAVVFLVVLILVAEILVACRGRFSSRVTDAWARRASRKFGASLLVQHTSGADIPSNVALTLSQRASLGDDVLVLVGDGVDTNSWHVPENLQSRIAVHPLKSEWWSKIDSSGTEFAIVLVSARKAEQQDIVDALRALAEVDVTRSLVLVGPAASEPFIELITLSRFRGRGDTSPSVSPRPVVKESVATILAVPDTSPYAQTPASGPTPVASVEAVSLATPAPVCQAHSVDLIKSADRSERGKLIDAQTVTIERNRLPSSAGKKARTARAETAVQRTDQDGVSAPDGVDGAPIGDDINSEAPTERIVLVTNKNGDTRVEQSVRRVGSVHLEGTDGEPD